MTSPSQTWLTVSENDEPYGELEFAAAPQTLNIEETIGYTEIKVLRRKGTYGTITVDYHTMSQTADSSEGSVMRFGVFQSFKTQNARTWYSFSAYAKQYLLLGAGNSSHGNDDAYIGSGLFYWQGVYTHVTVCLNYISVIFFLCVKYRCQYNKQNITWPFGDTNYIFSCCLSLSEILATLHNIIRISARPFSIYRKI